MSKAEARGRGGRNDWVKGAAERRGYGEGRQRGAGHRVDRWTRMRRGNAMLSRGYI